MIIILELFRLAGRIELDGVEKANKDLDNLDKKGKGLGSKLGGAAKKIGKAGAVIGGAMSVVGASIGATAFPMVKAAANMQALNAQFEQVFEDLGKNAQTTIDGLGKDFGMLPNRIKPSFTQMTSMFKGLGLSTEDAMESAEDSVTLVADAAAFYDKSFEDANSALNSFIKGNYEGGESIGLFANETQLAAYASKELGLDWQNLDEAGKQLARIEYAKAMQEAAGATGQASRESEGFENVMGNLRQAWTDLMTKFGEPLLEPVIGWIQKLTEWLSQVDFQPMIDGFTILVEIVAVSIQTLVGWIESAIAWGKAWFTSNAETMNGIWTTIQTVFTQVVNFLQTAWETIQAFWKEHGEAILSNAQIIFTSIWETVKVVFEAIKQIIQTILSFVVPWVQEKLKVIQKFWDENGEQIMKAVQNAFTFIQGVIEFVMPIIQGIIKGAWKVIQSVFDTVIGVIMGLVKTFSSLLTGDFEGIREGLISIWESLWKGIKGIVSGAWGMLKGALSGLWSNFSGWFSDLKSDALQWGKNMIQGFIDGIWSMGSKVANAAKNVVDRAADFIKFWSPAKKGEGRYITHWGRNMVDGFLDGVREEESEAGNVMKNVVKRMNPSNLDINSSVWKKRFTQKENRSSQIISNQGDTIHVTVNGGNVDITEERLIKTLRRAEVLYG